ncbi:MAG: hypothetical protein K8H77_05205, partial [Cutibacterium acnes]|nr:hypothetical protein [Cutibacterium acnes]
RERREDIPVLVEHFLKKLSSERQRQISAGALRLLMNYSWRGNIRELENVLERVLLMTDRDEIAAEDIPSEVAGVVPEKQGLPELTKDGIDLELMMEEIEKRYLLESLRLSNGVKTDAADLLRLTFRSFRHRLQKYGIR